MGWLAQLLRSLLENHWRLRALRTDKNYIRVIGENARLRAELEALRCKK